MGTGIRYALNRLPKTRLYLDNGFLELDDNTAERAMKPVAIGRKNWMFAGSQRGGKSMAIAFTLIDTAMTLNAMRPDFLVVRHPSSGAANLLASKVNCAVLNAGDGRHEHPTQALLDALTIRRSKGRLHRLTVAICGDIAHSRVARSNILLLGKMENRIRLVGPRTLMPSGIDKFGVEVFEDMRRGLDGADVVMMLRLQKERMDGAFIPSEREYYHRFGLDPEKLEYASKDAIVMHPGPMNRGVEIDGTLADDINRSVIQEQVEMGVAVRMAAMDLLARNLRAKNPEVVV